MLKAEIEGEGKPMKGNSTGRYIITSTIKYCIK